ncbi:MAG: metallophosphoesterase family protein [Verrucomicrobiota bacterium]
MRYAILSDIHANQQAWKAFLEDIAGHSIDSVVCLGDIIGYGPMPQVVLDGVRESSAAVVLGNHDAAVCGRLDVSVFNDHARAVIDWTRERLDDFDLEYLSEIPLAVEAGQDVLFVHAEAAEPGRFGYVEDEDAAAESFAGCEQRLIFCGHTHIPCVFALNGNGAQRMEEGEIHLEAGKRYLINVGSTGEPRRPDDLRGRYVIYDDEADTLTYRPLEFDIEAYREDLKNSGLDIKPYFLRAADFANGVRTIPLVPEQPAMRRLPVVPATPVQAEGPSIVVPPRIRPMIPPGARVQPAGKHAGGVSKGPSARPRSMPKSTPPAMVFALVLGLVLLAGAAVFTFPSWWGSDSISVGSEEVSEASLARPVPSEGDLKPTLSVSAMAASGPGTNVPEWPPLSQKTEPSEPLRKGASLKDGFFATWNAQRDFKPASGPYKGASKWMGKPKRARGRIGRSFSFKANDGFSTGQAGDHRVKADGMAISLWFQPENPQEQVRHLAGTASASMVASQGGWSLYTSKEVLGIVVGDGNISARLESRVGSQSKTVPWRHVAVVVDLEANRLRFFKNGSLEGETELPVLSSGIPAPHPLTFGVDPSGEKKLHYSGKIDEIAIWTRPLSASEISKIVENGWKKKSVTSFLEKGPPRDPSAAIGGELGEET